MPAESTTSTFTRVASVPTPPLGVSTSRMFVRMSDRRPPESGTPRSLVASTSPLGTTIDVVPIGLSIVPLIRTSGPAESTSTSVGRTERTTVNVRPGLPEDCRSTNGWTVRLRTSMSSRRIVSVDSLRIRTVSKESRKSHVLPLPTIAFASKRTSPGSVLSMSSTLKLLLLSGSTSESTAFWPSLTVTLIARTMRPALEMCRRGTGPARTTTLEFQSISRVPAPSDGLEFDVDVSPPSTARGDRSPTASAAASRRSPARPGPGTRAGRR